MKVVYIAAPFTAPTAWGVEKNVRRAEDAGIQVAELGAAPLIPHANTRFFHGTCTAEFWYAATLALMLKCDAVLMTGDWQSSKGCNAEFDAAVDEGIPVFLDLENLRTWLVTP